MIGVGGCVCVAVACRPSENDSTRVGEGRMNNICDTITSCQSRLEHLFDQFNWFPSMLGGASIHLHRSDVQLPNL